jgi:hypothetical protein
VNAKEKNAKLAAEQERRALGSLNRVAVRGVAEVKKKHAWALKMVAELTLPVGKFTGRRHGHAEPFDVRPCGWCANIRSWRWELALAEAALPLAKRYEDRVRGMADLGISRLWGVVQEDEELRGMTRDLVRALAREPKE